MRKGDSGSRIAALRNRLLISGDLEEVNEQHSDLFDDETIAKRDILPRIQEDPNYLARQSILVFESWESDAPRIDAESVEWSKVTERSFAFKLRQEPGPRNALGRIKFVFPNPFSVYLHGTPAQSLFRKAQRDFSSGCVRIEKPIELASLLLESEPGWTRRRIVNTVRRGKTLVVRLSKRIPVHLAYWTAWIDESGTTHFRDDIYGRDQSLESLLSQSLPGSRVAN